MKQIWESVTSYIVGLVAYILAILIEHKEALDVLAQVAHDITMIVAGVLVVGRFVYDSGRVIRWACRSVARWLT